MAKQSRIQKPKGTQSKSKYEIVTHKLTLQTANKGSKDVGGWMDGYKSGDRIQFPNRTILYDYYTSVLLDGHLTGILSKRQDALVNKNLCFTDKDGKEIEGMEDLINSRKFRQLIKDIWWAKMWGFSLFEFIPGPVFDYTLVPRKHVKPDYGVIAVWQNDNTGISYEGQWNFWFVGEKRDLGILLKCCPYALYKRGTFGDWAQFIEIFGIPMRVIYYDAHDIQTSQEIDNALEESGSALVMKLPRQSSLEIKDEKQANGNGDLQGKFVTACNAEMSVIVLGNTETTTSSQQSGYAQAKEHGKQQLTITESDKIDVLNWLNDDQFLAILKSYGYPVDGGKFTFEKEYDNEKIKNAMIVVSMVKKGGTPVEDDYIYDITGIPKPDNYDQLKQQQEAQRQQQQKMQYDPLQDPNNNPANEPSNGWWAVMKRRYQSMKNFFDPAP